MAGEVGVADPIVKPADLNLGPEASRPINYTPLPEFIRPTMTELPKYEEPTMTSPQDEELTKRLLAQVMDQKPKKPEEIIPHVEKNISQEKKSQGFLAQIIERLKTTFRNLFR